MEDTGVFVPVKSAASSDDESHNNEQRKSVTRHGSGPYQCNRCHKSFAREDLLRRHQNREARSLANPSVDRQKSCYACAKSKARCDLAYPQCGRCQARGIHCVYAPHTGNPNARRARERGIPGSHSSWPDEQNPDVRVSPYVIPNMSNQGLKLDYRRRASEGQSFSSSNSFKSFSMTDTSGEESDGNHTTDSTETSMAQMNWLGTQNQNLNLSRNSLPTSYVSTSPASWSTLSTSMFPSTPAPSVSTMTSPPSMTAPVSQTMLSNMSVPPPSFSGVSLNAASEANVALSPKMVMSQEQSVPKPLPQLSRLCTSNLGLSSGLQLPITPSRLLASALSPSQSIAGAVTQDWNSWLDEPIVPSPMYEQGPCTGWNGLVSGMDSRTPTAANTRIRSAKEMQNSSQVDPNHSSQTIGASPPVLISAIDWWKQDTAAQWQFHEFTMACFPAQHTLHEGGPKSTLSASVLSRFLTYCSFLCLREPTAPHPPFMHRHLLMMMKDRLPKSLAIVSSVMAALSMRLPASEAWAWHLLSTEMKAVVETARGIIAKKPGSSQMYRKTASLGRSLDGLDDAWEMVGVTQALWCYTVITIAEEMRNPAEATSEASMHRPWSSRLTSETIGVLQCLLGILAQTGFELQNHAWKSWIKKPQGSANVKPFDFLCWCMCETIRRTVLATHALLILLRHLRIGCDNNGSDAVLGQPPYPSRTYPLNWDPVMSIKLPVVADIFEETNEAIWRVHLENAISCSSNETMALNLFIKHRPKGTQDSDSGINTMVYSYFNQHDEFTNVCLSTLFGLTAAV